MADWLNSQLSTLIKKVMIAIDFGDHKDHFNRSKIDGKSRLTFDKYLNSAGSDKPRLNSALPK